MIFVLCKWLESYLYEIASKRNKFTAKFKLTVVGFAEKTNNSAAARDFNTSEKTAITAKKSLMDFKTDELSAEL